MNAALPELVETMLVRLDSGPACARPAVADARARMASELIIVVAGRRGVGKSALLEMLRRNLPRDAGSTRGRRFLELPDRPPGQRGNDLSAIDAQRPDALVYVAQQDLRDDEVALLTHARDSWQLGVSEVVVALTDPSSGLDSASRARTLRARISGTHRSLAAQVVHVRGRGPESWRGVGHALQVAERYAVAGRVQQVLESVAALAVKDDDPVWSAYVTDAVERAALSPHAHVLRERCAIQASLAGHTSLCRDLINDLVACYIPADECVTSPQRELLLARATRWQNELDRLPPRAADVARVVVRSCQILLDKTQPSLGSRPAVLASPQLESPHAHA